MTVLKKFSGVMANPTAYRLWQMPFAEKKFRPIREHNDFSKVRRVLDVGCGPGTNSVFFEDKDYVGMDINADYIQQAKRRFGDRFYVGDVCTYQAKPDERFDFILLNSLLHHIDDEHTDRILKQLSGQLNPNGHIHILDLVLPEKASVARTLAKSDRGDHPRPLQRWNKIFSRYFEPVVFEPYAVGMAGLPMWQMVYFKGSAKRLQQAEVHQEELETAGAI
jgi:SAM-dependent methyltransferase